MSERKYDFFDVFLFLIAIKMYSVTKMLLTVIDCHCCNSICDFITVVMESYAIYDVIISIIGLSLDCH